MYGTHKDVEMTLIESSSPCDCGDDHEKVKSLYDLVYLPKQSSKQVDSDPVTEDYGLRCVFGRGGPLDVGMFHANSNSDDQGSLQERNKLTLEFWVKYDIEVAISIPGNISTGNLQRHKVQPFGKLTFIFCVLHF